MDFFRFKGLLSGENQWGDQDSFLVPLKKIGHMLNLKFRSTGQFTYYYSWAYPKIVKTPTPIYISCVQRPFTRTETRGEKRGRRRETEKVESGVSAEHIEN